MADTTPPQRDPATPPTPNSGTVPAGTDSPPLRPLNVPVAPQGTPPARVGPGSVVAGRYELAAELARGGMGVVYRARDRELNRDVAVKLLLDRYPTDSPAVGRFLDEAQITGRLQHPGIPPVHQVGMLDDGRPFLAMKLIAGRTLADILRTRPAPADDLPPLVQVFEQVCQAVGFAHSVGVVHRDLKPSNVMVGTFGEVQVMDWGVAKWRPGSSGPPETGSAGRPTTGEAETLPISAGGGSGPSDPRTRPGSAVGTPAYMAPEQARGEPIDGRADVFALGAILCEVLTGERVYGEGPPEIILFRAAEGMVADAFARLDSCGTDAELVGLCRRCLSAEPAGRPADGRAVAEAVAAYRTGVEERLRTAERDRAAAEARAEAEAARAAEQRRRRRAQLGLAVAVLAIVTGGGLFAW